MSSKILVLIYLSCLLKFVSLDNSNGQVILFNRLKFKEYINNPYSDIEASKICTGTKFGLSAGRNDYELLRATYSNCVYVDGNLEITNFRPYSSINELEDKKNYDKIDKEYDFSFLDNIREITGYLLVFHTRIKTLRLKNLQVIRGKSLYSSNYSVFIGSNERLEKLEFTNLTEIQRGSVFIGDNAQLCHMNEINWKDIVNDFQSNYIQQNADPLKCKKCPNTCCQGNSSLIQNNCGCWYSNGCQKLTRVICNKKCNNGSCYGPGKFECCNKNCLGGCVGPTSRDCVACKKFRIYETGECVDSCPRIKMIDELTSELVDNPDGMYQFGITCVRSCPKNLFVFHEMCVSKCPGDTYEEEEIINNPITGEKGPRRICKPCIDKKCPKRCSINFNKNVEGILDRDNLQNIKDCEILTGNLLILQPSNMENPLNESELEVLSSIKVINGFVRIQSDTIKTLNFLRNLEIIRANVLSNSKYSLIVSGKLLKTLNLKNLKSIENGEVYFSTESLCLQNTIDWDAITKRNDSLNQKSNSSLFCNGYECHPECKGCWSIGQDYCQFCKSYKLDSLCIEKCDGNYMNNRYLYLENKENRICKYCNYECKNGCTGPTEFDCLNCANYKLVTNSSIKCVKECPSTHYSNEITKECLPCAASCYGCKGPEETLSEHGCINCNSALIENDNSYTIIKCMLRDNCPDGYVPEILNLKDHPLKGRIVCRKCHKECDGCKGNGAILEQGCLKCKNYYSNSTKECVSNCSVHNEYLNIGSNICLACDQECKLGCKGSSIFECNDCRGFKLKLQDVETIIETFIQSKNLKTNDKKEQIENTDAILNELSEEDFQKYETEIILLKNYNYFLSKNEQAKEDLIFCVNKCPADMPYPNMSLFCSPKDSTKSSNNFFIVTIIIISSIFVFLLVVLFSIGCIMKRLDRKNLRLIENEKNFFESKEYSKEYDTDYDNEKVNMTSLILLKDYELEKCYMLGHGAFGTVFVGFYKPNGDEKSKIRVAIKELNALSTTNDEKIKELETEIINEAALMASVKHKYCLQLSALCMAESIKIVTQLIPYGSAVSFLQKYRDKISEKNLLVWAQQIAEGMEYLEGRGIVHRDLAARNILIKNLDHIKITDFGLAKILDSEEKAFYAKSNSLLPIKWLAIESIQSRKFTSKSDVWSYGVCLWELFTFCAKPYAEIETINIISYLKKGVRLSQPQIVSIDVYALLLKCWFEKPTSRPSFKELSQEFSRMSQDPKSYLSFKSETGSDFITINENTQSLLQNIQNDSLDGNIYDDDDEDEKNKLYKKSNNNSSISPDEGIDINSFELQSEQAYKKNNNLSNYNQSLVVFKRNSKSEKDNKNKKFDYDDPSGPNLKKNKSFLRKLLSVRPKRLHSQTSTATTSTYMSSVYSDESNQVSQQSELLNYEEQQSLLTSSSSQLPTRSNSSNNSSIYNYNGRLRDVNNTNSDYLEPVMHNVKENFEYFGDTNQKSVPSIIVMDKDKTLITTTIAKKSPYYNDSLI